MSRDITEKQRKGEGRKREGGWKERNRMENIAEKEKIEIVKAREKFLKSGLGGQALRKKEIEKEQAVELLRCK